MSARGKKSSLGGELKRMALWVFGFVALIWLVEGINTATGGGLDAYGIRPRTLGGFFGILAAPFIHASVQHVVSNTMPLIVLGWLVIRRGVREYVGVSLFVILVGGGAVWLFGRSEAHTGVSGVVFGYFGLLLGCAWYERSLSSLIVALLALVLYGGMVWGLVPADGPVSWESHLFGFLAGFLAANLMYAKKRRKAAAARPPPPPPDRASKHDDVSRRLDEMKRKVDRG